MQSQRLRPAAQREERYLIGNGTTSPRDRGTAHYLGPALSILFGLPQDRIDIEVTVADQAEVALHFGAHKRIFLEKLGASRSNRSFDQIIAMQRGYSLCGDPRKSAAHAPAYPVKESRRKPGSRRGKKVPAGVDPVTCGDALSSCAAKNPRLGTEAEKRLICRYANDRPAHKHQADRKTKNRGNRPVALLRSWFPRS